MLENIHWLGHATFKINCGKVIYIDPYKVDDRAEKADIILITHDHYDHNSTVDVGKVSKITTLLIAPNDVVKQYGGSKEPIEVGETIEMDGITVRAVPAYNISRAFHPRNEQWVGYIITIDDVRIYHAGDTDFIPEMKDLNVDIALMPVGGTYTMSAREAADAVNAFKPKLAIPMHYDSLVGKKKDAEDFKEMCDVDVVILPQE